MIVIEKDKKNIDWCGGDTLMTVDGEIYMICKDYYGYCLVNLETGMLGSSNSLETLADNCICKGSRKINLRCEIQDI